MGLKKDYDLERDKKNVREYQSVKTEEDMRREYPDYDERKIIEKRIEQGAYSCLDEFGEPIWNHDAI